MTTISPKFGKKGKKSPFVPKFYSLMVIIDDNYWTQFWDCGRLSRSFNLLYNMQPNFRKNLHTNISVTAAAIALLIASPVANSNIANAQTNTTNTRRAASIEKPTVINISITEAQVLAAQKAWGDALVSISTTYEQKGIAAARELAGKIIDQAYGYQFGAVLFKPTLAKPPQTYRTTRQGALAYFVGGDPAFPSDSGFALKGWRKVEIRNAGIFINGDTAMSLATVVLTDKSGKVTSVDKTWGFIKDSSGKLRIILHHSSLPYGS
ncbi:hypothetical protein [Cylindrospermopsis raciborskii]|uniref:hypothetical protein n=1 Tax=Cylindrospermopsis raciborskii TaxID=77022 RepID=UPI00215AF004|nr:hypothetical protein [Cylindrospermopsis raciborskii]